MKKLTKDSEEKFIKGQQHKEALERKELEKAATLLENLEKKRKAVEKFELMKRQLQKDTRGRNVEKHNITMQQAASQQQRENQITREMVRKEKKVANKLQEAEI